MAPLLLLQVSGLVRGLLNLRFLLLLASIVLLGRGVVDALWVSAVMIAAALAAFIPLWFWHVVAPSMLRHPCWLALDVVTAVCIVVATGAQGPFLHFTLTTAVLSGLLQGRRGALVTSVALVGGYFLVLMLRPDPDGATFQQIVGAPALYPMAAAAAAGVRALLDRQAETERALAQAHERIAASRERARLARELHDSLSKTLHGIALSAGSLQGWAARGDLIRSAETAGAVVRAARTAAGEARALIGDLRDDRLDRSLAHSLREYAQSWAADTGIRVVADVEQGEDLEPSARYELFFIFKESLRNVARHAGGGTVHVTLRDTRDGVTLVVADDGVGFSPPRDLADLGRQGHYGLIGMAERAERAGGVVRVVTAPGAGVTVTVELPLSGAVASEAPAAEPSADLFVA